jgi:alpha-mannosidase
VRVEEVKVSMYGHQQADVHPEYLMPNGLGDGGGGPTSAMCERARRLNSLPGMPEIKWDQPEAFFDRMAPLRDRLPVHQGECYLEFHRGTYTTHGNLKATFRGLERALHLAEAVSCVTGKRWDLTHPWKRLVFSQFHDFIPGSSVWDVYIEGLPELNKIAQEQTAKAAAVLSARSGGVPSVFNPHALPVKRWINRPGTKKAVYVSLPPLGGVPIPDAADEEQVSPVEIVGHTVSNGLVEFRVNANGWIDRLTWEGSSVPLRDPLGQLMIFPDRAARFEPWDIDRQTLGLGSLCRDKATVTTFREGTHRAGVRVTRKIGNASKATVIFALEAGSFLVDMTVEIDWQDPEHLIKMLFPTRYAATNARFGGPFGSVLRPQVSSSIAAEAMWEVPFSRYLAVFDEGERGGLFVATEAKYGATVRDGVVGVSLVRSPHVTGYEQYRGAWPVQVQRLKVPSPFSDLGRHRLRLAMGRYDIGLPRERQPAAVAETQFSEPLFYTGGEIASPLESIRGGETLVPAWAKPAADGSWILRLHEVAGCRGRVQIKAKKGWTLEFTDLKEAPGAALNARGTVAFEPYRVTSVRFRSS